MRTTLVLVAAAVFVFLAGWWIDDQLLNNDVPRAVSVAEVDIGDLAHDDAVKRLEEAGLADARIELRWADVSIERTAAEFGVVADVEAAVAQAEDRGSALAQPYRWARSLFVSRSIEPSFRIDRDVLASYFDTGSDAVFPLDFGRPQIELIDGVFVEVDIPQVAAVDVEALESLVLAAARDRTEGASVIEVPTTGLAGVDLGADQLVASANDLIDHGLRVEVLGSPRSNYVSAATIEGWIRFGGTPEDPTIELDAALVQEALDAEEWGFETSGTEASFVVDDRGDVRIVAPAGVGCCAEDTTDRILAALTADDRSVDLLPDGDAEENGIVWAQSLGGTSENSLVPSRGSTIQVRSAARRAKSSLPSSLRMASSGRADRSSAINISWA